ncbi:alpha/beta fold hydrolase [Photobacterium ganghwense]|uniref:alpha/beta fold hydrolase n=1 Tax=Photobacterium ganghwense TaxID=320778 RepID=UPI001C2CEDD7|nr:alpha/beta hydrolase [Photobacterium ganghwense]MBV1839762.1 alpha/beta hydrolase [Photobacterium ganghwense]
MSIALPESSYSETASSETTTSSATSGANESARPIILLRGLLRESRHWGAFTQMLEQHYPSRPVICLDLAGNGKRFEEASPSQLPEMVEDLRQQLALSLTTHPAHETTTTPPAGTDVQAQAQAQKQDLEHTQQPVQTKPHPSQQSPKLAADIIAISMGGMIAMEWMHRYPEEIHQSVLINTSARPYSPFYHRLRWQNYPAIQRGLFQTANDREATFFRLTTRLAPAKHLEQWCQWRAQCPVSSRNALRQLFAAARFTHHSVPSAFTLLLASKQDKLVDVACSKALAKAWAVPLLLHPAAGHDLPLDDPEWVLNRVTTFFRLHEQSEHGAKPR